MGRHHGIADVHDVVREHLPGYPIISVQHLGEGLDNVAYEVNGGLIVRFSTEPDPVRRAGLVNREARLLAAVSAVAPLPVPTPVFTAAELGCLAYLKLPGVPLLDLPRRRRAHHSTSIATALGELLAALHAVPVDQLAGLVETDDPPLAQRRREAARAYRKVAGEIPAGYRGPIEAFLDAPPLPDRYALVFSHNDLGIEHVLVDPLMWTVTGIIDWSDAAIVDPARDFGLLYRDLGPAALHAALPRYQHEPDQIATLSVRALFYARCGGLEDLEYGLDTGRDRYVENSLAALQWLFPA